MSSPFMKVFLLLVLVSLSLCSCDKLGYVAMGEAQSVSDIDEELSTMNVYAEAYNAFLPFNNSYENFLNTYKQQQVSGTQPLKEYRVGFRTYNLRMGLASLERSRESALGPQFDRLEAAADELIRETRPFLANVELLEKYQESKGYLEDIGKLARDKDAEFTLQAEAFILAYKKFLHAYNEATIISNQHFTEALRANHLVSKAYVYETYFFLKQIAMLFESVEDLKDEQRQAKSVGLGKEAKKSLDNLKLEAKNLSDAEGRKLKTVIDGLDALYTKYDEFKEGKYRPADFERFAAEHNEFIKWKLNPL